MKQSGKRTLYFGIMLIVAFIIWTILIKLVDVRPWGQNGTEIGFATFNMWFHKLTGVHMTIYTITDWLGSIHFVSTLNLCFKIPQEGRGDVKSR